MATLNRTFRVDDFEAIARRRLPKPIFDFYAGGAEDERTLALNRDVFQRFGWTPRVMTGSGTPDLRAALLGRDAGMPVIVAPMGAVGYGCIEGDQLLGQVASDFDIPYTLSTTASTSIEQIGASVPGRKWFQLYPLKDRALMKGLIGRARACGFETLIVTVDVPVGGKRERDLRNDCSMPFRFTARNLAAFASRPAWALNLLRHGPPGMPNLSALAPASKRASSLAPSVGAEFDHAFGWAGLAEIRKQWDGPLLVKGILRPDDAERTLHAGCDGVIVSNHGGRQLDTGIPALAALAAIVSRVDGRTPVFFDGGIRRGSDIAKALCLGAAGVLVGRPLLYGVCAGGHAGASRVLTILRDELSRTMQLCGAPSVNALGEDLLRDLAGAAAAA
ncbi:alpha-hydroxy acid oxidase [Pigmentiphaga litoralis]|uniref:(S)-mandelate dehydrogenase n=1 Tax=Pigmentiphaga litoralis TaxID=516702 RepID=A0A7Y9IWF1_9BURK|nr:alpha-hydroxy acid oxidase [Pigmentiphaga litoralis]NYE22662.1 (S)-mandelate dehydrogenase [Pigmentiphaga litoralis]NYE83723.1 (S)-mandelate dehydrogenase [Pigmentiphaga litoralis]